MEKFEILLGNEKVMCIVTYKNMRSIRMRVKEKQIVISAPCATSRRVLLRLIKQHQAKLLSQIQQYTPYYEYVDQGYVFIFNQKYQICLRDVGQMKCQIHDHQIYVYHHSIQKCVEAYLKQILYDYLEKRIKDYLQTDYCLPMPDIEIKKYKGRWGSCFYEKNKVSFNLSLVYLRKELIDYVIVHELTHFLQPNHSPQFYYEVAKRLPDYKYRQDCLKEEHV